MMVAGFTISTAIAVQDHFDKLADHLLNVDCLPHFAGGFKDEPTSYIGFTALHCRSFDWFYIDIDSNTANYRSVKYGRPVASIPFAHFGHTNCLPNR
jgi:hypothetical protein